MKHIVNKRPEINQSLVEKYQKLESEKINTFYKRKSVRSLTGDDLQAADYQAIYYAKIILIVGTAADRFESLMTKYMEFFDGKSVIPVYTDIRPDDLPSELNRLQALNYGAVGAESDLVKGILRLLGREKETEFNELRRHTVKKRKTVMIVLSLLLIVCFLAVGAFFVFHKMQTDEPESEISSQEIYDKAQSLMESGDYLGAAELFTTVRGFKNSSGLLDEIYNRYDGYYTSNENGISFYINIQNAASAEIAVEKTAQQGKKISVRESAVLDGRVITVVYTDSQDNAGKMTVTLDNDIIKLKTVSESENDGLSIGNLDIAFLLEQRSDRPMEPDVNHETIMQWLTAKTTLSDLKQSGYNVEFSKNMESAGGVNDHFSVYLIDNTDIKLLLADFDLSETKSYNDIKNLILDDYYIVGIIAPESIAVPQKTGEGSGVYGENGILYAVNVQDFVLEPETEMEYCVSFTFNENALDDAVSDNSAVGVTSKALIGDNLNWVEKSLKESYVETSAVVQFKKTHSQMSQGYYIWAAIAAEKSDKALVCVMCNCPDCNNKYYYYKHDVLTDETKFIVEVSGDGEYLQTDIWKNYPDFFNEFLEE